MQLQRAQAVVELAHDLKQAVAKEKKRRLKHTAGLLSDAVVLQLCLKRLVPVVKALLTHFAAAESQRLKKEFEQDLLFLEQVCDYTKRVAVVICVQAWDTELQRLLGEQAALQQMASSAGSHRTLATLIHTPPVTLLDLSCTRAIAQVTAVAVVFSVDAVVQRAVKQGQRPSKGAIFPPLPLPPFPPMTHRQQSWKRRLVCKSS
jgi:hypothetical protein